MPVASAIFLIFSLILAVLFGAQTSPWSWGPALICLLIAKVSALSELIKKPTRTLNGPMLIMGGLTVIWFGIRALHSPVSELGMADLLLLASTVGGFLSLLAIQRCQRATHILTAGIAGLLLANLMVMLMQICKPGYSPLTYKSSESVTGFFTHYNYAANYLLFSAIWLLAHAWHSRRLIIKIMLGLLGALGLASIYWTKSRGGLVSALIAMACLGALILVQAKRDNHKWFPIAAIATPFVLMILIGILMSGWQDIQSHRSHDGSGEISRVLDSTVRLNYLGIAVSCMTDHPLLGGGSQSFAWECYQHWDIANHGGFYTKPEFVHNEWLQAATDYGLIGFLLILGLMSVMIISVILRACFETEAERKPSPCNSMRMAGLAGLVGLLVHANFSFIFHLMPGALMLGMSIAAACQWNRNDAPKPRMQHLQRGLVSIFVLSALVLVTPLAWKGTRVLVAIWPSQYAKNMQIRASEKLHALDKAIKIWPQASLYLDRAILRHDLALASTEESVHNATIDNAIADYQSAQDYHPYQPESVVNQASLLSHMNRDNEAAEAYELAIRMQGGMERTFRGRYLYASHLILLGAEEMAFGKTSDSIRNLENAADQINQAHCWANEKSQMEITVHELLGLAYEFDDRPSEAMQSYLHAASLYHSMGRRVYLRVAILQAALANEARLAREPSKALDLYLKAKRSVTKARGQLPDDITAEQRSDFVSALDASIKSLREIGIEPASEP